MHHKMNVHVRKIYSVTKFQPWMIFSTSMCNVLLRCLKCHLAGILYQKI